MFKMLKMLQVVNPGHFPNINVMYNSKNLRIIKNIGLEKVREFPPEYKCTSVIDNCDDTIPQKCSNIGAQRYWCTNCKTFK